MEGAAGIRFRRSHGFQVPDWDFVSRLRLLLDETQSRNSVQHQAQHTWRIIILFSFWDESHNGFVDSGALIY